MLALEGDLSHNRKRGLLKNMFSVGLVQVANYVFPFITIPIVSRIIGPERFGVINFAAAFVAYFTLLINFGFDLSATRAIAANRNDLSERNRIFNQVILAKTFLFAISLMLFLVALFTVPQLSSEKPVAVYSFLICLAWVITPNWLYQGMQELSRIAIFNLAAKVIFTVIILMLVREKEDYFWQPLSISIAQIIVGVFSFWLAVKRYRINLEWVRLGPVLKMLWSEKTIFFSMVVINLYTTTNVVLLGFLQPQEQVGYYTAAWRLMVVIQTLIAIPLSQSLFPFVGTAFSVSREKGLDVIRQLLPIITILTTTAALMLWALGPLMIRLLYGPKFDPTIQVFRVLAFIPVLVGWSNLLGIQTMINLKMDKTFFRITGVGAIVSILMNFLLVTRFGFVGTAWCWLLTEFMITGTMFVVLARQGITVVEWKYFTPSHFKRYLKPILLTVKQKMNR